MGFTLLRINNKFWIECNVIADEGEFFRNMRGNEDEEIHKNHGTSAFEYFSNWDSNISKVFLDRLLKISFISKVWITFERRMMNKKLWFLLKLK